MNWIAVEESGGMTRWINLDNVTEVRSVSEAQITVRIYTTGVRSETQHFRNSNLGSVPLPRSRSEDLHSA